MTGDDTDQSAGRPGAKLLHDLKNCLGAITLEASMVQSGTPHDVSSHIERILEAALRAQDLAELLAAASRRDFGEVELELPQMVAAVAPDSLDGLRIVVVDDEVLMRDVLCLSLRSLGAEGHAFEEGGEALEYLTTEDRWRDIDLVLADLTIPAGMNGTDLARELNTRGITVPTAGMTGYSAPRDPPVTAQGLVGLLAKPFDIGELLEFVDAMLALEKAD